MKKIVAFFTILLFSFCANAQVLCIKCYNQNARILTDTNNLIVNGGFENTNCVANINSSFCPYSLNYACNISNWTCTGGNADTYARIVDTNRTNFSNVSIVVEGIKAAYFGNWYANFCSSNEYDTSCISNNSCIVTGIPLGFPNSNFSFGGATGVSLEQVVNGLAIGATYVIEFWAGGESQGGSYPHHGVFAADVGFGKIFLKDPPTSIDTGIGTRYLIYFTATSTSDTIRFTNWGFFCGDCYSPNHGGTELVLDDVRLFASNGGEGDPCAAGIGEVTENEGVSIFPNPIVSEELNFTYSALQAPAILIIINITGQEIARYQLPQYTSVQHLNLPPMASGMYVARLITKDGGVSKRFVKE